MFAPASDIPKDTGYSVDFSTRVWKEGSPERLRTSLEKNGETVSEPLVHKRFADPATSGLEFEVPKQTKWEIVVEKP